MSGEHFLGATALIVGGGVCALAINEGTFGRSWLMGAALGIASIVSGMGLLR